VISGEKSRLVSIEDKGKNVGFFRVISFYFLSYSYCILFCRYYLFIFSILFPITPDKKILMA
jgi:hypothetical protein